MRFSVSSLLVVGACLLSAVSANPGLEAVAESIATTQHGIEAEVGARGLEGLLAKRAANACPGGSGLCPNDNICCPLGGDCCGNKRCCGSGNWCYGSLCCPNNSNGCAGRGCCPKGSNCCADGGCCQSGYYCYYSPSHNNDIRCCPNGKRCN